MVFWRDISLRPSITHSHFGVDHSLPKETTNLVNKFSQFLFSRLLFYKNNNLNSQQLSMLEWGQRWRRSTGDRISTKLLATGTVGWKQSSNEGNGNVVDDLIILLLSRESKTNKQQAKCYHVIPKVIEREWRPSRTPPLQTINRSIAQDEMQRKILYSSHYTRKIHRSTDSEDERRQRQRHTTHNNKNNFIIWPSRKRVAAATFLELKQQ